MRDTGRLLSSVIIDGCADLHLSLPMQHSEDYQSLGQKINYQNVYPNRLN